MPAVYIGRHGEHAEPPGSIQLNHYGTNVSRVRKSKTGFEALMGT